MKLKLFALIATVFSLVACQSNLTKPASNQTLTAPIHNSSRIVFMRTSMMGAAIQASVYDVTNGNIKFIGIVSAKTRVVYNAHPGKHLFMVVAENADFMAADMSPGKTYHAIVTPRYGVWKARFSLHPVRKAAGNKHSLSASHIKKGLHHPIVENKAEAAEWYLKNRDSVTRKYQLYHKKWRAKPTADKAQRTLFASDGL